eukprot:jgi/Psemu1/311098/fgenesh1_kg.719_\
MKAVSRIHYIVAWAFLGAISGPSASSFQTIGGAEAFAPSYSHRHNEWATTHNVPIKQPVVPVVSFFDTTATSRGLPTSTSLASAKVLPFAYTGFSGALLYKAVKCATDPAETMVLAAVSALSFFNLAPSDNARLASAKRAYKKTDPASAGKEKQVRQAALTWRKAVRIKIVGQVIGLTRMLLAKEPRGVMKGAAWVMGATMTFVVIGGGSARHDDDGNWKPMPEKSVSGILLIDAILFGAALVAGDCTKSSASMAAMVYTAGVTVGSLEGIPQFVKAIQGNKKK